jgi:hypothetical protein
MVARLFATAATELSRPAAPVGVAAPVPAPRRFPDGKRSPPYRLHQRCMVGLGLVCVCSGESGNPGAGAGITNIVWASSETVLGLPFATPPLYVLLDEECAPRPKSSYSLVKTPEEAMAVQLCRWHRS